MGGTLRLGTLSEYRRAENHAVRDEHEGTFKVSLDFPQETTVSIEALQRATLHTSPVSLGTSANNIRTRTFSGRFTEGCVFSVDNVSVASRTDEKITLSGNVTVHSEGADAYVLCLSKDPKVGSIILDPEYNSVWSIKTGSILDFANEMIKVLTPLLATGEYVSQESVGPFVAPGFQFPRSKRNQLQFCLVAEIWPVLYREREIVLSSDISENVVREIYSCIDRSASIKPSHFIHEAEVRIIFRPSFIEPSTNRRFLSPMHLKPVLLPFDPFLDMIDVEYP